MESPSEGGFNEEFSALEDLDLGLRMKQHGKLNVDPLMQVYSSPRRMHQLGHVRVFLEFANAYYDMFVRKQNTSSDYFDKIDH